MKVATVLGRLGLNSLHLRAGFQVGAAVFVVMAAFSTPAVWDSLTLSSKFNNPSQIVVYLHVVLLTRPVRVTGR
jgi:hypothetical protein